MFGSLRNLTKSLMIAGLLFSVNSHAYIASQNDSDPGRVNVESKLAQAALVAGGATFFLGPVAFVTAPGALVAAGILDGDDAKLAQVNTQQNLADLVQAGVYTESEAQSILADLSSVGQDLSTKMTRLGCDAQAKVCTAETSKLQNVLNLRPLTMEYLNNAHGVQN